jgi:hypothetical protein
MPKTRQDAKKKQESVGLSLKVWAIIDELQKSGLYGDSRGEIARNLILDQLKLIAKDRLLPEDDNGR